MKVDELRECIRNERQKIEDKNQYQYNNQLFDHETSNTE